MVNTHHPKEITFKVISRDNPINIVSHTSVKENNKLKVKSEHNPQEIVDIEEIREDEIEEKTWEIRIEERKNTEVFEENQTREIEEPENEIRDTL